MILLAGHLKGGTEPGRSVTRNTGATEGNIQFVIARVAGSQIGLRPWTTGGLWSPSWPKYEPTAGRILSSTFSRRAVRVRGLLREAAEE